MLSVPEAADRLGVHPSRVRQMIADEVLEARKLAGRWLIEEHSVRERESAGIVEGRPFSPRVAWGALFLLEGRDPDWLLPSERSRLRRRLAGDEIEALAPRLRRRAQVHRWRGHPASLRRLSEDRLLRRSGVSAREYSPDLMAGEDMDAYVPAHVLDKVVRRHHLAPSDQPNVALRAVEGPWPFLDDPPVAPVAAVVFDLWDLGDSRSRRAARRLAAERGILS